MNPNRAVFVPSKVWRKSIHNVSNTLAHTEKSDNFVFTQWIIAGGRGLNEVLLFPTNAMEYSLSHVSAARIRDKHWTRLSGQKMQKLSFFRDRLKPIGAAVAYTVIFALFTSIWSYLLTY